jgi:hypothetical protein
MDRRYYLLKASILALAIAIPLACGMLQESRTARHPMQDAHFQAASIMEATMRAAGTRLAMSVLHSFSCAMRR